MSSTETTPVATAKDVRDRTNIDLDEASIDPHLKDAVFDIAQSNTIGDIGDGVRKQLEWRLAAYKILSLRKGDRAYHSQSLGSLNRSYEVKSTDELREEIRRIAADNGLTDPIRDPDRTASINVPGVK